MAINKWRNAGVSLKVLGVPAPTFFIFFLVFPFPHMMTIYVCVAVISFYAILGFWGYSVKVMYQVLIGMLRGRKTTGRPWWYRKYNR